MSLKIFFLYLKYALLLDFIYKEYFFFFLKYIMTFQYLFVIIINEVNMIMILKISPIVIYEIDNL